MPFVKVTAPTSTPISLMEAKAQIRELNTYEDSLINSKIKAATEMFEQYTNRALVSQTWEWTGIDWPGLIWFAGTGAQRFTWPVDTMIDQAGWFMLRPAPLATVNSVKVWSSGSQQTLSSTQYLVDTKGMPGRMRFTGSLPSPDDRADAITINFTCGYASTDVIPEDAKEWIKMTTATLCEVRQQYLTGTQMVNLESYMNNIIAKYCLPF